MISTIFIVLFSFIIARTMFLMIKRMLNSDLKRPGLECVSTAIIMGSGGHTTEMLRLINNLKPQRYTPRLYIMASTDKTSEVKIHEIEMKNFASDCDKSDYTIIKIPRSRNVSQSYITSVFTTLYSVAFAVPLVLYHRPELVLCNGPGTCVPICMVAFLMKVLWITNTTIIFVESVCRVHTLSLSGKLLLPFADQVYVQWPQLQQVYKRTKYIGRLV